jgi:hypothetical protein
VSRLRHYLFGRTRRQKYLRIGAAAIFAVVIALMAWVVWGGALAPLILPVLVLLLFVWAILAVLDLREGLRDIANREP